MKKKTFQCTEFQNKKKERDSKILARFREMEGMKTALYSIICKEFNVSPATVQQVIQKSEKRS